MKRSNMLAAALVALSAMAFTPAVASAQSPAVKPGKAAKVKGERAEHGKLGKLLKELNLTDKQKADLKPILMDQRTQAKAIREDAKLTPEQKKDKLKDLAKATHEKIAAILTPEQKAKLKELRKHHDEKPDKGAAPAPGKP